MFGRKKEEKRRANRGGGLSQFGLFDLPNNFDNVDMMGGIDADEDDEDDDALEAELLALTSGKAPTRPKRVRQPAVNLDAMVAESMKDIPSDEELSGDENDPELLKSSPIPSPAPPSVTSGTSLVVLLEERLKMYQEAESNAKTSGESSRARRFGRGIKTLNDLLKQARAGRVVNEEDIPPPVVTTAGKKPTEPPAAISPSEDVPVPVRPAPPPPVPSSEPILPSSPPPLPPRPPVRVPLPGLVSPTSEMSTASSQPEPEVSAASSQQEEKNETLNTLKERQSQYKRAALQAKRAGDNETAIAYVRIAKQFDAVIAAVMEGNAVDLSAMPPPPSERAIETESNGRKTESEKQNATEETPPDPTSEAVPEITGTSEEGEVDIYSAPPPPSTVMEALEQRLMKYRSVEQAARDEGNSSKARRMGRIVKQYESAVKLHRAGKPIPIDELPTPPGFGPIPIEGGGNSAPAASPIEAPAAPAPPPPTTPTPAPRPKPVTPVTPKSCSTASPSTSESDSQPAEKKNVRKNPQSRQEKQLSFLVARQKEFKEAALQAKRKGELPVPPDTKVVLESDFDFITVDDCIPGSDAEIFEKLEEDLLKQAKMCLTTRDHFKAIGDVASANRFEQLAVHSKKDLDAVRCAHKRTEPIPKFHYETRSFSIVQCCTDLGDNDLELTIVQGINYTVPNPKDVDTYVKFEFPYPSEDPPKDRTSLIKDTNNPEYNASFNLTIHRNSRACQRVFKRHSIKLEVWSRGLCLHSLFCCQAGGDKISRGFFRSDSLIGTVNVKLLPLETKCVIHDSFDLMDGRKAVGGKLEVKVRVRNPILTKQVEQVQEKWLVIDRFQ
ncbi:Coiled-coil and C2 domain-containing-like protein 1 [Blattella germanica]|nr:Coiled-coil and C2 domain-containing-like protein 1 [Blattella germanica]